LIYIIPAGERLKLIAGAGVLFLAVTGGIELYIRHCRNMEKEMTKIKEAEKKGFIKSLMDRITRKKAEETAILKEERKRKYTNNLMYIRKYI
jgi:hypothetical protein